MRATVIHAARDIRVEDRDDPTIIEPGDVVVRVVAACVCGSDLWPYRGVRPVEPHTIGHEFVGTVTEVGDAVTTIAPGDFVIAPFTTNDGTCQACRHGITSSCEHGSVFGGKQDPYGHPMGGAQAEIVRVPDAEATLVVVPGPVDDALVPSLLTLSDVFSTGHHAAVSAGVGPGKTVVVVGDGAVGLCAVLAAARLGADHIIAMSRHEDRQRIAREFGATDIVATRGDEGIDEVRALLGGELADCALEAVGTKESMDQALRVVRPGGAVGYVGVPAGGPELPMSFLFGKNITVAGGVAPVRAYLPELLPDVLSRAVDPGRVFDLELPLEEAAEAYAAMDERRAVKVLLRP
ncbi:IMP dehydrogenase [Curtobacterium sp. MCBD17_034]|uniref:zinc-binding dehydrogenase n=1 Tax=unclassified Curtobacterium TaxID=257496 RepID=UPI000DAACC72|nr:MULTISPECIES: alcohol dehydrogenase catalytic domain-containing protein [unclassified Curtobacterium]PZF57933.1 IMP dehydrogenase [Curtobacterium sp. MCBD17_034]PZM33414.1 IMP dehydrogenase [Curtobacterium sp. MCBD17_031]WIE53811.1 alcohol dehydrogenase catalytic domain-containing protein [Curtobacterium sp. MCBD17_003]